MRAWILLVIVAFVNAGPVNVPLSNIEEALLINDAEIRNSALENVILNLIEDLRQTMLTGSDDVPVLDPFYLESISIDDQVVPLPGISISVSDLTVSKLSTFVVDSLSLNLASIIPQRYRLQLVGNIPNLVVEIDNYDLDLSIFGGNIFGNGNGRIDIIEPRITADMLIAPRISIINGIFISIVQCDVKFSLAGFEPHITGLMNDEAISDFINLFLKNLVPEMIEHFETEINEFLSDTVLEIANEILADLNLGSILG